MKAVFKTTGSGGGGGKDPAKDFTVYFSAGETIFEEGELGTEMYIIQDGQVDIVKRVQGDKHLLARLEKGDFFGEMSVIDAVPRSAEAVAASDVKLLSITGARFDEMLRKNPEIAIRIIRKYSKRLREANAMIEKVAGEEHPVHEDAHLSQTMVGKKPQPQAKHESCRIVDVTSGTAFYFSQGEETLIGRADPVTGILPDIDLTTVDTNRSVSRRHAKILRVADEFLVLEEVGTVNGTFVNDQRIPTGQPVPLKNGDRLKVGLVQLKVIFD